MWERLPPVAIRYGLGMGDVLPLDTSIAKSYSGRVLSPPHTRRVFNPQNFCELVDRCVAKVEAIMAKHPEIQALAGCGHSGLPLLGALCSRLKLPMIVVRKEMDTKNDDYLVNGALDVKGYLFVDDLISSGKTVSHVKREIAEYTEAKLLGCLLYDGSSRNYPSWLGGFFSEQERCAGYIYGLDAPDLEIRWDLNYCDQLAAALGGPMPEMPAIKLKPPAQVVTLTVRINTSSDLNFDGKGGISVDKPPEPPPLAPLVPELYGALEKGDLTTLCGKAKPIGIYGRGWRVLKGRTMTGDDKPVYSLKTTFPELEEYGISYDPWVGKLSCY